MQNKYIIECELRWSNGHSEPGDSFLTWSELDKKVIRSGLLFFPNEVRKGDKLTLGIGDKSIIQRVDDMNHHISRDYTLLTLDFVEVKSKNLKKGKKEFEELVEKYSFLDGLRSGPR